MDKDQVAFEPTSLVTSSIKLVLFGVKPHRASSFGLKCFSVPRSILACLRRRA
jgi:hypothetical protein